MTKVKVHWVPEHEAIDVYIVFQVRVVLSFKKEKKREKEFKMLSFNGCYN
jgi:hypothetical protein